MKEIILTQNQVAIVDDEDYEYLSQWKWFAAKFRNSYYAARREGWPKQKTILIHRTIMGITDSKIFIDHIDGNGLNNCRENLRLCDNAQNQHNVSKRKNNTTGYKGVFLDKRSKHYFSQIMIDGKSVRIGTFNNAEEAAKAYDQAAKKYYGNFARLNFEQL